MKIITVMAKMMQVRALFVGLSAPGGQKSTESCEIFVVTHDNYLTISFILQIRANIQKMQACLKAFVFLCRFACVSTFEGKTLKHLSVTKKILII